MKVDTGLSRYRKSGVGAHACKENGPLGVVGASFRRMKTPARVKKMMVVETRMTALVIRLGSGESDKPATLSLTVVDKYTSEKSSETRVGRKSI